MAAPVNAEQEAGLLAAQKLKDQGYRPHRIEEFLKGWYAKHPGPVVPSKVDANG